MDGLKNSQNSSWKMYLHLLITALIGFLAYSNTFHAPFALDDINYIKNNQLIKDLDNFISLYQYNPRRFIGYLSFALNYHFAGSDVIGYHLTNLFIHIVNAFLVYFLVKITFKTPVMSQERSLSADSSPSLSGSALMAFFVALLFVSHPVQTATVTYTYQRFVSLATFFYLFSIILYIKGRFSAHASGVRKGFAIHNSRFTSSVIWYLFSIVSAIFAIKTKEIAFTLPLVIILYDATFFNASLKKKLLVYSSMALMILIIGALTLLNSDKPLGEMLSQLDEMTRVETTMSRWDYLMTQMPVVTTYIRLIFLPINQNLDYDYPIYRSFFTPPVFLSFAFLLSIIGLGVYLLYKAHRAGRKSPEENGLPRNEKNLEQSNGALQSKRFAPYYRLMGFGILWFFITLSVESSVIPIDDVIFEHRLYLPSVGIFIAITAGLLIAAMRLNREKSITPLVLLITLMLSTATFMRNTVWADSARLWEDVVRKSPNWDRPHNNLGTVYYDRGRLEDAMREFQTAVRLNDDYADAHNNLGVVYEQLGRLDEALKEYQTSVLLKPDNADMHNNLGSIYERLGRLDEAIREYQSAIRSNPEHADAIRNLEALGNKISRK